MKNVMWKEISDWGGSLALIFHMKNWIKWLFSSSAVMAVTTLLDFVVLNGKTQIDHLDEKAKEKNEI